MSRLQALMTMAALGAFASARDGAEGAPIRSVARADQGRPQVPPARRTLPPDEAAKVRKAAEKRMRRRARNLRNAGGWR